MKVRFISPSGRKNEADLTAEQVALLKQKDGYIVL
jgi:hypothetical protein